MGERGERVALSSVGINAGLSVAKLWGGVFTGSAGLVADGLHSTLDVLSSGIAYLGTRTSREPPDAEHRYGHHKFEYFAGAVITGLLLLTGVFIVQRAVDRLLAPTPIRATTVGIAIAAGSLVANEGLSLWKTRVGRSEDRFSLRADAMHDHADAASSLVVLVGLVLVRFGVPAGDAVAALGVAAVVFWVGLATGREAFDVLVDRAPDRELMRRMDGTVRGVDGVLDAHAFRARMVGETVFVDLHVLVAPEKTVAEGHEIAHRVEDALEAEIDGPAHVVVHVEPEGDEAEPDAPPPP